MSVLASQHAGTAKRQHISTDMSEGAAGAVLPDSIVLPQGCVNSLQGNVGGFL